MKPTRLLSILFASGVLFACACAAPGEVHSPASSEGATTSQPAVSSQMPVSSQPPVSSAPASSKPSPASSKSGPIFSFPTQPDDYKPKVALNLSFDPRVYVATFCGNEYFNKADKLISYDSVANGSGTEDTSNHKREVFKGKYQDFYYYPTENTKEYIQWLKTNFNDIVQMWGSECYPPNSLEEYLMSGLRADGTVYWDHEERMDPNQTFLKTVKGWKDLVFIIGYGGSDAIGLKSDGTVVFAPNRYYKGDEIRHDDGTFELVQRDVKTALEKVFHPELFHDIVMISSDLFDDNLYLLRKDGVLFDELGQVLYEQVERMFPPSIYCSDTLILLSSGEVINLFDHSSYGTVDNKEKIITIKKIQDVVCALMEDGSFQIIWHKKPYNTFNTQLQAFQKIKDCKTN